MDGRRTPQNPSFAQTLLLGAHHALFAAQASLIGVDYVFQLVAGGAVEHWVGYAAPAVLGLTLFIGGWRLSTRSQLAGFGLGKQVSLLLGTTKQSLLPDPVLTGVEFSTDRVDELLDDPAPGAKLANSKLWIQQPILHRLRRKHLSTGILVVAIVVAWASDRPLIAITAAAALVVLATAAVTAHRDGFWKTFSVGVACVIVYPSLLILGLSIVFSRQDLIVASISRPSTHTGCVCGRRYSPHRCLWRSPQPACDKPPADCSSAVWHHSHRHDDGRSPRCCCLIDLRDWHSPMGPRALFL